LLFLQAQLKASGWDEATINKKLAIELNNVSSEYFFFAVLNIYLYIPLFDMLSSGPSCADGYPCSHGP
jgi:hypothetical protein